jgi:hypothetical protein
MNNQPPSDSGITAFAEAAHTYNMDFNREYRQKIAAMIVDVLTKGYVTRRDYVVQEAQRRNMSVEQLLAAYLARKIMDRVDNEYI